MTQARILIVEDEIIIANDIEYKLINFGYSVIGIESSGEKAVQKALEDQPDLIMMDINLKGELNGIEAAEQINKHLNIPIIFLTSYSDQKTVEAVKHAGGTFSYLLKPIREREFHITIEMILYRHYTEKKIKDNEKMLQTILNSMSASILIITPDGKIQICNPMTSQMLGYDRYDLELESIEKIIELKDMPSVNSWIRYLLKKEVIRNVERIYIKNDGYRIPVLFSSSIVKNEDGSPKHIICVAQDITDRKLYEDQLIRSQKYAQSLINSSIDMIVATDKDGNITEFNTAAQLKFQYHMEEIIGKSISNLFLPIEGSIDIFNESIKRSSYSAQSVNLCKDGTEFKSALSFSILVDSEGEISGLVGVIRDITEQKMLEQRQVVLINELREANDELQKSQEQLVQSEKMASLGQLVAGVAHEINTPIGVALTSASRMVTITQNIKAAIVNKTMKKSEFEKYLADTEIGNDLIIRNLKRTADLIKSFKMVSADQTSQEIRKFNIKAYLADIVMSLKPKLKQTTHEIEIECPETLELDSNPGAIAQIITNLIMNSLLHAFNEGVRGKINLSCKKRGDYIILQYSDNGNGIPEEHLKKIFDPFFTTKRGTGGTGLGLNIVYNIVTQTLKGSVKCESKIGHGTTFIFELPIKSEK
ncbi:MAG: PAS domain S-box protein [Nitrospirae bacterium]|nr:PAS domain S-box protein [Nitrospirota bacterium]